MKESDSQRYIYTENDFKVQRGLLQDNITTEHSGVQWINFHSLDNTELINKTFETFLVHKLTRDDILQLIERPKIEEYDNYIYTTLKTIRVSEFGKIDTEQISFIITNNTLISFQERHGDMFNHIRDRIEQNEGIVRKKGVDYLLYLLIEAVFTEYDGAISFIENEIETLMKTLSKKNGSLDFEQIEKTKETLRKIKGAFHPFRDQISKLINTDHDIIKDKTRPFFMDIRDNILYISDELETAKNELESLTNLYFARVSQKSNEVMQFLTIVAAIFIPLTFLAGIYGMNFENMPELKARNGYFVVWGIMITVAVTLIFYFRKKKWF